MSDRDEAEVKPRILHLEDDPADRELIREALGAEGIPLELVQVDRKAEFEAALASGSVALVLSDFALPHFDGFSALDIVQKEKPNLPFIFVSGTMGEEAAIESLRRGATDYVLKERLSRLGPWSMWFTGFGECAGPSKTSRCVRRASKPQRPPPTVSGS